MSLQCNCRSNVIGWATGRASGP